MMEPAKDRMRNNVSETLDRACAGRVVASGNSAPLTRDRQRIRARTRIGLATTTRPTKGESNRTIELVLPGALDDDLVIELQLSGELQQTIAFEIDLPGISEFPIFQNGRLGE
jgi:hypothetical protein